MEKKKRNSKKDERTPSKKQRFNAYKAGVDVSKAILDIFHNMFQYGKWSALFSMTEKGEEVIYRFWNRALKSMVPTYERLSDIVNTAGEECSTKKFGSLFGMGIEVFALTVRKSVKSTVKVKIKCVRDNLEYYGIITYNSQTEKVSTEIWEPISTTDLDSFEITFSGDCKALTPTELNTLKHNVNEMVYKSKTISNVMFGDECLKGNDYMYADILKGTEYYKEWNYLAEIGNDKHEDLSIQCSDVKPVIVDKLNIEGDGSVSSNGVTKISTDLAGASLTYNNIPFTSRRQDTCRFWGQAPRNTCSYIRSNVDFGGDFLYKQVYAQSTMKQDFTVNMNELTDMYEDTLMFIDKETGEKISCKEVAARVRKFYSDHESDENGKEMRKEFNEKISKANDNEIKSLAESIANIETITGTTIENMKYTTIVGIIRAEEKRRGL